MRRHDENEKTTAFHRCPERPKVLVSVPVADTTGILKSEEF